VPDGVVLDDDLDLAAADLAAGLLLPQLDRTLDLLAGGGLLSGHRQDDADLQGLALCVSQSGGQCGERQGGQLLSAGDHCCLLKGIAT
jgi:hypothetical protein